MFASVLRHFGAVFSVLILLWGAAESMAQPVTQPFTFSLVEHTMPQVAHAVIALGDFDNDGDLDVYLAGIIDDAVVSGVYRNDGIEMRDGAPTFVFRETDVDAVALAFGDAAWGDYDADGHLDLVITGSRSLTPPYDPESILYRNDGGRLTATSEPLDGFHSGVAEWGDVDNDGDLDLLLGGQREDGVGGTRLFRNEDGSFVDSEAELPGLAYGDAAWGDADGDDDLDLIMTGISRDGIYADVYGNDAGLFSRLPSEFTPAAFADVSWGDFDEDGDLDVIQTGGFFSPNFMEGFARIYRNTNAAFNASDFELPGALSGAGTWGDYDNDGDLDLFVMGAEDDLYGPKRARIFARDESSYTEKIHLTGVVLGTAVWGDLDGDGDLDLVASGRPSVGESFINIYENRRQVVYVPVEPLNLATSVSEGSVKLRWDGSISGPASFNIRIGSKPGLADVVAPMSDVRTGRRRISAPGNTQLNNSWTIHGLEPGEYYWSVQAIDAAFAASPFAPEQRFTISQATSSERSDDVLPVETYLYPAAPNPSSEHFRLQYDLADRGAVAIRIYDLLGRTVAVPVDHTKSRGRHTVEWDGRDAAGSRVASGLYLCEIRSGSYRQTVTLIVAR